jgi:hypothetical protein
MGALMPDPKPYRMKAKTESFEIVGHTPEVRIFAPLPKEHSFYAKVGRVVAEMEST